MVDVLASKSVGLVMLILHKYYVPVQVKFQSGIIQRNYIDTTHILKNYHTLYTQSDYPGIPNKIIVGKASKHD